jgi:hypothetical protein
MNAACVGASTPATPQMDGVIGVCPLLIHATGRHSRHLCQTNAFGFPDEAPKATSEVGGFRTDDLVRAVVPSPRVKAARYVGRIAVRATGSCNPRSSTGTIQAFMCAIARCSSAAMATPTSEEARRVRPAPDGCGLRAAVLMTKHSNSSASFARHCLRPARRAESVTQPSGCMAKSLPCAIHTKDECPSGAKRRPGRKTR